MIYTNFRGGINSDKVKKARLYQQNMAKGKERYRQESISKWTDEDQKNWNRLLRVREIYLSIMNKPIPKEERTKMGMFLRSIEFVSNQIYSSCNEWGKALSFKQIESLEKAEKIINEKAELLI